MELSRPAVNDIKGLTERFVTVSEDILTSVIALL
jgi:hypothetical protein